MFFLNTFHPNYPFHFLKLQAIEQETVLFAVVSEPGATARRSVPIDTAEILKGSQLAGLQGPDCRGPQATQPDLGLDHLRWNRGAIRKAMHELESGMTCLEVFHRRQRKPAEEYLPRLLDNLRSIAECYSQTDHLFTCISATTVRRQSLPDYQTSGEIAG
jgi:hypothetical protein